jgi:periplasmic divalent cation tolerance protein
MKAVLVYMVCGSEDEARKIAQVLLAERLVACANIMAPHSSLYWWNDKIETGQEVAVILKTRGELFERVKEAACRLHSYECPCIIALPIENGYEPFLQWIEAQTAR